MRVQSKGRVRRSRAEWRGILDRFAASGQSQAAFCRREGISKGSLSRWKQQIGEGDAEPGAFVELAVGQEGASARVLEPGELELALPGGVSLRWRP